MFEITTAAALLLFSASRPTCCSSRSGWRAARCHQRHRPAGLRGRDPDRPRPCRVSRRHGRIGGRREGRDLQARLPGGDRRPGLCRGRRRPLPARRGRGGGPDPDRKPGFPPSTRSAAASSTRTRPTCSTCRGRAWPDAISWSIRHRDHGSAGGRVSAISATPRLERGLTEVDWPGRLQRLGRGRLAAQLDPAPELWLDGGHNIDGGRILAAAMADLGERSDVPLVLIVGLLSTKDADGFLRNFVGLARALIAVPITTSMAARGRPKRWRESARMSACRPGRRREHRGGAGPGEGHRLRAASANPICGSLYLAGLVLAANDTPPV